MEADDAGVIVMDELSPNPMHAAPTVPDVDTHALKTDAERSGGEGDKYAEVPHSMPDSLGASTLR